MERQFPQPMLSLQDRNPILSKDCPGSFHIRREQARCTRHRWGLLLGRHCRRTRPGLLCGPWWRCRAGRPSSAGNQSRPESHLKIGNIFVKQRNKKIKASFSNGDGNALKMPWVLKVYINDSDHLQVASGFPVPVIFSKNLGIGHCIFFTQRKFFMDTGRVEGKAVTWKSPIKWRPSFLI